MLNFVIFETELKSNKLLYKIRDVLDKALRKVINNEPAVVLPYAKVLDWQ